jgi:transcription antitermination factor NusG
MKKIDCAAFPGYIFCRFDVQRRAAVLSSAAVHSIVGLGRVPSPIPEDEIGRVRRAVGAGGQPVPYPRAGRRVRIEFGALAGLEGVLTNDQAKKCLLVSIELLQRSVAVQIDESQIRFL